MPIARALLVSLLLVAGCRTPPEARPPRADGPPPPTGWHEDRLLFVADGEALGLSVMLLRVVHDDEVVRRYRVARVRPDEDAILLDHTLHGGGDPIGVPPHAGLVFERRDGESRLEFASEDHRVEIRISGDGIALPETSGAASLHAARGTEDWIGGEGRLLWVAWRSSTGAVPPSGTEVLLLDDTGEAWLVRLDGSDGMATRLRDPAAAAETIAVTSGRDGETWVVHGAPGLRLSWRPSGTEAVSGSGLAWVEGEVAIDGESTRAVRGVLEQRVTEVLPPSPGPRDRRPERRSERPSPESTAREEATPRVR
jgi:hypothetical protein